MRSLLVVAILLVTGAAARAESFSFVIGGQAVRIGIGSGCADISCISVDVSGHRSNRSRRARNAAQPRNAVQPREEQPARPKAVPAANVPQDLAATEPVRSKAAMVDVAPATQTRSVAPAQAPGVESTPVPMAAEPAITDEPKTVTDRAPTDSAPGAAVGQQAAAPAPVAAEPAKPVEAAADAAPGQQPPTVIAALPPPKPATEPRAKSPADMAIGTWSGSDGQLRIESCGQYLCGYAAGGKHAGKMVLINMRQTKGNTWAGRVRDMKGGGTYSAHMTLRGAGTLRVEGCAFGGMVCQGRTLSRVD